MAATSRFAHLLSFGAKKASDDKDKDKEASADKPTQNDGESDEDFEKRLKKWEDEQDDGESAESPKDTSDDDQDQGDKKAQAAIDAARAEGNAAGITAERNRWAGILASPAAAGRIVAACSLLADTDMNAASITKTLAALPVETARSTLAQRHETPTPAPSTTDAPDPSKLDGPKGFAARVAAAVETVRPSKAKSV